MNATQQRILDMVARRDAGLSLDPVEDMRDNMVHAGMLPTERDMFNLGFEVLADDALRQEEEDNEYNPNEQGLDIVDLNRLTEVDELWILEDIMEDVL